MKNIVLTGFMATGKTTVGKNVAKILNFNFIDTDCAIEKICGLNIQQIFEKCGEKYFRHIENIAIKRSSRLRNHVIATGGGVVLNPSNIVQLRKYGIVICLKARVDVIIRNIGNNNIRPLLNCKDKISKVKKMIEEREHFYKFADFTIDVSDMNINEVTNEVINAYLILKNK